MKKQYFAWKNGEQSTSGSQQWEEITVKDCLAISRGNRNLTKEHRRFFARVSGVEENDTYYVLECDYKNHIKSVAEAMERWRKRIEEEKLIEEGLVFEIISLDLPMTDENGETYTLLDMIPDPDSLFEDKLITSMDLHNALLSLSKDERHLIDVFYLSDNPKTERSYADEIGTPYSTIHRKKMNILKKMREKMAQNNFFVTT